MLIKTLTQHLSKKAQLKSRIFNSLTPMLPQFSSFMANLEAANSFCVSDQKVYEIMIHGDEFDQ